MINLIINITMAMSTTLYYYYYRNLPNNLESSQVHELPQVMCKRFFVYMNIFFYKFTLIVLVS
ncbi:hypothetical protein BDF14DRAFT_1860505 [Spinellus fusiger]|nr:hypothetical protein BDF14DRAFT_1860505 [Spinellus fusiger]